MRVYELAKQLGMESRRLIPELGRLGIEVTSHNNALSEEDVKKALAAFEQQGVRPVTGSVRTVTDRKKGTSPKSSAKAVSGKGAKSREDSKGTKGGGVSEEMPKPGKKHILIKRRKAEPVAEEGEAALSVMREGELPPIGGEAQKVESPVAAAPSQPETPLAEAEASATVGEVDETAAPPQETRVVEEEPLLPPAAPAPETPEPVVARPSKKTPDFEEEKKEGPEKRKGKKGGRHRDEDLFSEIYEDAARWQDLRPLPSLRREDRTRHVQPTAQAEITKPRKKSVKLTPGITVKEFAELLGQRPADVIRKLMEVGLPLTLNQPMNLDAGILLAEGFGVTAEIVQEKEGEALLEEALQPAGESQLVPRPPVVTVMGHVDHGKTSLLDAIRKTKVTERESGGITQHIGAYTVETNGHRVTFLDTPGHEAFTAMRARGAQATDIVVLVVAADDGVMPQTLEAAHHAQAANVPIIVAINKIDKPGANPERVMQGLSEHGLIPEAWGGQTIYVEVSAKQQLGLDTLLDMIVLQAEVLELKAEMACTARGVVLESQLDRGRGPVATVLVQAGVLRVGDAFVVGQTYGRVRAMVSHDGKKVTEAGPSTPVEVIGLLEVPSAGDQLVVVKDERAAREIAQARQHKHRLAELESGGTRLTLDDLYSQMQEKEVKELSVVIKADVQGSMGALREALGKLSTSSVKINIIHSGVGGITESDVLLAAASRAIIIGFHVRPEPKAAALAEREGVDIRLYTIIYNVLDDVRAAAEGLLSPTVTERVLGRAEVREVFNIPKVGSIAGCYVNDGVIMRSSDGVRVIRDHVTVYEGKVGSLRRFKDDVREVQQGYECGIGIEHFNDLKVGDIIEAFMLDKVAAKL